MRHSSFKTVVFAVLNIAIPVVAITSHSKMTDSQLLANGGTGAIMDADSTVHTLMVNPIPAPFSLFASPDDVATV